MNLLWIELGGVNHYKFGKVKKISYISINKQKT